MTFLAYILFIYSCFCLLFTLAVLLNIIINSIIKGKVKFWQGFTGNMIAMALAIVYGVLILTLTSSVKIFVLICEIVIVVSTLLYTNKFIMKKLLSKNTETGKMLYKTNIVFYVNIIVWATYLVTEIILQFQNLQFISITNPEVLFVFKANEAAILIVLAAEIVVKTICNYIIMRKEKMK